METTEIKENKSISLTREEFLEGKEFYTKMGDKVYTLRVYKKEKSNFITETFKGSEDINYTCTVEEIGEEGVHTVGTLLTTVVRGYTKFKDMISKERYKEE